MDNNQTQDAQSVTQEAADLLEEYASYVRTVKADDLERHPYLPEIERVASKLRLASQPTSAEDAVAWMYEKPDDGRPYIHDRLLRDYKDAIAIANGWTETPLYTRPTPDTSAEDADADNTPHSFDWGAPGTCRKCGNGPAHPVHTPDTQTAATSAEAMRETLKPFAEEAAEYDRGDNGLPDYEDAPDESSLNEMNDLKVGDLRRARKVWAALSQPVAAPQVDWSDEAKQSWEAQTGQPSDQMPQPEGGTVAQEVERLRTAIEQALKCTPFIRSTPSQFHGVGRLHEIAYECGDPWKILWAALQPEKTK